MNFDPKRPIYDQLLTLFRNHILTGRWGSGQQIPPVRSLAKELKVNANTLQRALLELEREGLCYTERTVGRFVTTNQKLLADLKEASIEHLFVDFIHQLDQLDVPYPEAIAALEKYIAKEDDR